MAAYALTIFTGAFLLFQVQPLIGKYILPWFGGGPGVWTTCMLFFQVLLLGGYAYAHFSSRWLKPRTQALAHLVLLAAALALLPITPGDNWKPHGAGNPTWQILALLGACLGLPYFVLSTTGPLLQQWFSRTNPGRSPYRLYALSNAGSLLALVSYPFFFEPHCTRKTQAALWGAGLVLYALVCGYCAVKVWKAALYAKTEAPAKEPLPSGEPDSRSTHHATRLPLFTRLLWLLLPACASVLLLATTNKLCQDVAVIPFLWVLPLGLYLLSFIVCFDSPRWYARFPYTLALAAALAGLCYALFMGTDWDLWKQIAMYSGGLFVCCMVCHGELYRLRPAPQHLTAYYLLISAGGALGGVLVAVVAPLLFKDFYELHWGLAACGLLFLLVCASARPEQPETRNPKPEAAAPEQRSAAAVFEPEPAPARLAKLKRLCSRDYSWAWMAVALTLLAFAGLDRLVAGAGARFKAVSPQWLLGLRLGMWAVLLLLAASWVARKKHRGFRHWQLLSCLWMALGLAALSVSLWRQARESHAQTIYKSRNFYGVLTVFEYRKADPQEHYYVLQHGRITHGLQFADPEKALWPTSYYSPESGIGRAMNALPAAARRVGVVGLGTGSLTVYGRPADYFRIYEIDPQVERLATSRFTYLRHCPSQVEVVPGDARLSLEQEPPQQFDLLALDAFSSDAVPVHLLTVEAFRTYERHLKTNGVLAVHISNKYLDLEPMVSALARQFNYQAVVVDFEENEDEWWFYGATWVLLTRNEQLLNSEAFPHAFCAQQSQKRKAPLWTDDFTSLFQLLQ